LSKRNPTWHSLGWEPEFRGEGPSYNGLSHDTALNFMDLLVAGWLVLYGIKKPEHKDREISTIKLVRQIKS